MKEWQCRNRLKNDLYKIVNKNKIWNTKWIMEDRKLWTKKKKWRESELQEER